jgi:hypothetical protein
MFVSQIAKVMLQRARNKARHYFTSLALPASDDAGWLTGEIIFANGGNE